MKIESGVREDVGSIEGDGGEFEVEVAELDGVRLQLTDLFVAEGFFGGIAGAGGAVAELIDLRGDAVDGGLEARDGKFGHELFGGVAGDEVDGVAGGAVGLVAEGVVPVEVGVDNVADGFGGDFALDLLDEGGGGGGF